MRENQGEQNLELSIRGANLAKRVGATTVRDLVLFSEDQLLETRCFGETSLREIKEELARRGLRLGMALSELQGRSGLQAKIVVRGRLDTHHPVAGLEHEGACCGHCRDAARKLREQMQARAAAEAAEDGLEHKLAMSLAELELSVRVTNCLEAAGLTTVRDLVLRTAEEVLAIRNFGPAFLREVTSKLAARGLHLEMPLATTSNE
jgi:DNA-directed RNA polymerase alpha subunit